MYIFIDTISPVATLILFKNKKIISKKEIDILGKEYDKFLNELIMFLSENNSSLELLEGIAIINGPGGFTGTRIVSLTINTICLIKNISVDFFDYFYFLEKSKADFPMIIKANRGEYLIKRNSNSLPELILSTEIESGIYCGIGNLLDFENKQIYIEYQKDFEAFILNYDFNGNNHKMEPFYIKKPNIS